MTGEQLVNPITNQTFILEIEKQMVYKPIKMFNNMLPYLTQQYIYIYIWINWFENNGGRA